MAIRAASLLALALLARPAAAHNYPIKPVSVVLRVEPDRIAADIDSDSIYWIEEVVGLYPMAPRDWPADARAKTEAYVNAHLRLAADGRPLPGRLIAASYVQRPWEVNEQGRFRLRMQYPPVVDGAALNGQADFFEDYRRERLEAKEPILPIQDFRTLLTVPGFIPRRFELKPGAFFFSLPAAEARRGSVARLVESFNVGAAMVLNTIAGWPALAALALSLAPLPSRRRCATLLGVALLAAAPWPGAVSTLLPWLAGASAALAAGRWLGETAGPVLEAGAAAALGRTWTAAALPWLPRAAPGAFERAPAAAGLLAAAFLVLALGLIAVNSERRRLTVHSESRAAELFERRRRLAATALLIVCVFGLLQSRAG